MPQRVLIIDDQLLQREYLRSLFLQAGVSTVDTAEGGVQALEMLDQAAYGLILTDLLMPDLDGVQFIQQLSRRATPPLLAIVSTSSPRLIAGAVLVADSLGLRVIDQISKPATPKAIAGLVLKLRAFTAPQAESDPAEAPFLQQDMQDALATGQMQAWFQPKMRIADGLVVGAEALVRWVRPDGTVLLPGQFLPSLILGGLEEALLTSMVHQTMQAQALWKRDGHRIEVSINLPTHLLDQPALPDRLHAQVVRQGGRPGAISFELTESSTTYRQSDYYAGACRLRMKGFGLAQDDSGQGYSSLFKIASTPFTEIKIDRALTTRCAVDDGARAAVESIIFLGRKLGLNVVAEGVETREQLAALRDLRCSAVQGYLISRALTDQLFAGFLRKQNTYVS
jgi:EAL domain-containing protein (putative c-di-GMP-specific phosphodiesterase class I)/DNA-binding NarL/FixJ family response regulator